MNLILKTLALLLMLCPLITNGQINKPSLSPRIAKELKVGMAAVTLDYGQPNRQDRQIFGGLIPYGKVWRTGANSSTKISVDQPITLAGQNIPAGSYSLYSIPGEKEWTIIIHKNTKLWGSAGYDQADDLLRIKTPVVPLQDQQETFRIYFENFHANGADLSIAWENSKVSLPFYVDSDALIFEEIETKIIKAEDPSSIKAQTYFDAAQFYYHKEKDLEKAVAWFDKAIELRPAAFWYVYYRAELAYHLQDFQTAKEKTQLCLAQAQSGPADYGYIAKCELLLAKLN